MDAQAANLRTFYVVQSFSRSREGLCMDAPIQSLSKPGALRTAERLSKRKASVIALARTGNVETGEFDEPVVLAQYGEIATEEFGDLPF